MLSRAHGLLFSVKQRGSWVNTLSWLTCYAKQRCPVVYTHVALLFNNVVYETSILGTQVTLFNYVATPDAANPHTLIPQVEYDVFLVIDELDNVNVEQFEAYIEALLDNCPLVCTNFVTNALSAVIPSVPDKLTPDELYGWLTLR